MIPYGKQNISEADIDAVVDVLKSDYLTQGPVLPQFEKAISDYCEAEYAIATNSATSALHVACLALDVGPSSLVWTSAISFVASSNCALYCGATVDFIDIEPDTINVSPKTIQSKIQHNIDNGLPLPNVVIVVHMAGQSCDMEGIHALSKQYSFSIIEDASHAIGGRYNNEAVGCCSFSDITVFSFHPVKIITTAEGGMALTNSDELAHRMELARSHGVTRDPSLLLNNDGPWYYEQVELGLNYRMTEMQAALGLSQIKRLDKFISERQKIAKKYTEELHSNYFTTPKSIANSSSSWHLYILQLNTNKLNRKQIFETLRERGLGVNVHYRPIYLNPYYKNLNFQKGLCPVAEEYYGCCISIPLYHGMTEQDQNYVITIINEVCV